MAIEPLTPERRRQQTREHLLAAAAQVFAERGFHGATLDEVATVAGFTKGAVYSNFKNKEDLFLALFRARTSRRQRPCGPHWMRPRYLPSPGCRTSLLCSAIKPTRPGTISVCSTRSSGCTQQKPGPPGANSPRSMTKRWRPWPSSLPPSDEHLGAEPLEDPIQTARIIEILFRGIGMLRILQPGVADESFIEGAISFVARGLGVTPG